MKYFLVDVIIRDGEHEHRDGCTVRAKTIEEAMDTIDELKDEWFGFGDGQTECINKGIRPITTSEKKILEHLNLRYCIN